MKNVKFFLSFFKTIFFSITNPKIKMRAAALRLSNIAAAGLRRKAIPTLISVRYQSTYPAPAVGLNPAYDEALKVISAYKIKKTAEAKEVSKEIEQAQKSNDTELVSDLKKKWFNLAVEAEINDSEVLWNAKHGNYDLSKPVYQYLKEKEWNERPLEVLMQRLLQMFVLPDLLDPRVVGIPTAQLNIVLPTSEDKDISAAIEPGVVIEPQTARKQPEIELVTFHKDTRLHTLVMVDLDEPFEQQQTFREQFHWVVGNVPFSMTQSKMDLTDALELMPYIPPHPAKGTPTHRYAIVAFAQGEADTTKLDKSSIELDSRHMVLREFAAQYDLHPVGISFFRANWDESVDEVYRDVLQQTPPEYGEMPPMRKDVGPDGRKIDAYENY